MFRSSMNTNAVALLSGPNTPFLRRFRNGSNDSWMYVTLVLAFKYMLMLTYLSPELTKLEMSWDMLIDLPVLVGPKLMLWWLLIDSFSVMYYYR